MPEIIHCRVRGCGWGIKVKGFEDGMDKLRRHRKKAYPALWKKSVEKGIRTKRTSRG